jgi:hypothetical protein
MLESSPIVVARPDSITRLIVRGDTLCEFTRETEMTVAFEYLRVGGPQRATFSASPIERVQSEGSMR